MHHSSLIFWQHANDIYIELLNDKNLSNLKPCLFEVGEHLNQLNKKIKRYTNESINDAVIEFTDETTSYINNARNEYMRKLVAEVKYEQLKTASNVVLMCKLLNYTIYLYNKTVNYQTKHFVHDFENLRIACNRLLSKYDCLLNDNNKAIIFDGVDAILKGMCDFIVDKLIAQKNC